MFFIFLDSSTVPPPPVGHEIFDETSLRPRWTDDVSPSRRYSITVSQLLVRLARSELPLSVVMIVRQTSHTHTQKEKPKQTFATSFSCVLRYQHKVNDFRWQRR